MQPLNDISGRLSAPREGRLTPDDGLVCERMDLGDGLAVCRVSGRPSRAVMLAAPDEAEERVQMQAAWFAFLHAGRRAHPRLRVLLAMLAGGAPLQLEPLAMRGGRRTTTPASTTTTCRPARGRAFCLRVGGLPGRSVPATGWTC